MSVWHWAVQMACSRVAEMVASMVDQTVELTAVRKDFETELPLAALKAYWSAEKKDSMTVVLLVLRLVGKRVLM